MRRPHMCGTDPGGQGGIAAVLAVYQRQGWLARHGVRYLVSHRAGGVRVWAPLFLLALARLLAALLAGRVTLLHAHVASRGSFWRKSLLLALARAFGVPTVLHLHGGGFRQFVAATPAPLRAWIRHSLERSTRVLALSDDWRAHLLAMAPRARVEVLANPVEPPDAGLPRREPQRLLFLGRAAAAKGVFDLLQALQLMRPRHPRLQLAIGGDGDLQALRAAVSRLGLDEAVELLGWVKGEAKAAELARAAVFVLPSYQEGLPMALLEAMAAGLPVVSTPVGGIPQALRDGQEGLLVAPGDVQALAAAIERLLVDPELAQRLGAAARARVTAHYASKQVLARLDAIYAELVR